MADPRLADLERENEDLRRQLEQERDRVRGLLHTLDRALVQNEQLQASNRALQTYLATREGPGPAGMRGGGA